MNVGFFKLFATRSVAYLHDAPTADHDSSVACGPLLKFAALQYRVRLLVSCGSHSIGGQRSHDLEPPGLVEADFLDLL